MILCRIAAIATEMTRTLERSAWTSLLALSRDYSCAIYDAELRQIATHDAVPVHTNSMHLIIQEITSAFAGDIHDGDVFMCNHPFRGNTHIGDLATACPVFVDGRLMFWSVTRAHQQDVGSLAPSSFPWFARNVWQEGLHIPPVKLYAAGKQRRDIVDLYLSNVRYPELLYGDLLAQVSSVDKGRARLLELVREYDPDAILSYTTAIIEYAARRTAKEIATIPQGTYVGESWVDADGDGRTNIPIRVTVTVESDRVSVDFTGSAEQSRTAINGTMATSQAAPAIPFMCYIDKDIPHNHGSLSYISIDAPLGTICNARYPAATATATITPSNAMIDAINKAMAQALPDRVFGGASRAGYMPDFSGTDERTGEAWGTALFNSTGGGGASKGADGWPTFASGTGMGCLRNLAIEQLELLYPLAVEQMEVETDSMGLGTWLGGPGTRFRVRPTDGAVECVTFSDGSANPPHGVMGGTPGDGCGHFVEHCATGERRFFTDLAHFEVGMNEMWVGVSTGGGGYGDPLERPEEQVRCDVRDGFLSRTTAREVFGVVVDDGFDPAVDREATERLRATRRDAPLAVADPLEPGVGDWARRHMRPGDVYVDGAGPESGRTRQGE